MLGRVQRSGKQASTSRAAYLTTWKFLLIDTLHPLGAALEFFSQVSFTELVRNWPDGHTT